MSNVNRELLQRAAASIEELTQENRDLKEKLAAYERKAAAEEIVGMMERKGISEPNKSFQEKVATVLASGKDLGVLKEAVAMYSSSGDFVRVSEDSFGLDDRDENGVPKASFGYGSRFEAFIVGER